MPARRWAVFVALALLSACSDGPPRRALAPGVVAAPPNAIDGTYHGIARLIRAAIAGCPRSGPRTITIEGHSLSVNYRGARAMIPLLGTVTADGAVQGSDGQATVEGQISGRHLDLTVSSQYCDVRYALERV